jgi:broad specificity phosphatase PhoE
MRLYLIRHGQSTNNILTDQSKRTYDPLLTDLGKIQADHLAEYIATTPDFPDVESGYGITHLYTSAMRRTLLTTQPLAQRLNITPQIWTDIHEIGGLFLAYPDGREETFGGITRSEIERDFPDYVIPDHITEDGWYDVERGHEKPDEFLARAIRVAYALRQRTETRERIVLVSHAAFLDALVKALLYQAPMHPNDLFYLHYNTGITRFDFGESMMDNMQLQYFNRTAHLTPELRSW